ncbi:MAG: hypothetical protein K6G83_13455 [Lachnospiraceae bacterium]|nr:hypothetical protein [Lachnospiraceae bacterium]
MNYTDYDLMLLNRIKGAESVCLIGEDVLYFQQLIQMIYKTVTVRSYGASEILGSGDGFDYILIGDSIIKEGAGKDYLYRFTDIGFMTGLSGNAGKEENKTKKDTTILAVVKTLPMDFCCNAFIRAGYEILRSQKLRVMENAEEAYFLFDLKKHEEQESEKIETPSRYQTVYVLCPKAVKTGGAELLHQLVYHINRLGGNAYITYILSGDRELLTVPAFERYVYGHVRTVPEIIDEPENAVIIPEGWFIGVDFVRRAKRLFWWLSVDNFLEACMDYRRGSIEQEIALICQKTDIHLYQSAYARTFVELFNGEGKPLLPLSDYLNDTFLENSEAALKDEKQDMVLYNPKKGIEFTSLLMEAAPDLPWKPIENLTTEQVQELLRKAKVYIDFGNHPGKDRIPREAAISGCIVITGRRGSAANEEDVPIPDQYKLDEETKAPAEAVSLIRDCIGSYAERIGDFAAYRDKILKEKDVFETDLKMVFFGEA